MRRLLTMASLLLSIQVLGNVDLEVLEDVVCFDLVDTDVKRSRLLFNRPWFFKYNEDIYFIKKGWEKNQVSQNEEFGHVVYQLQDENYSKFLMPSEQPLLDYKVVDDELWVLTYEVIQVYKLSTLEMVREYETKSASTRIFLARGFEVDTNHIYLAHGKYGLVVLDRRDGTVLFEDLLNTKTKKGSSRAIDIVRDEGYLYVLMTGSSEHGFNGVTVYDFGQKKIVNSAEYNERSSGIIDPRAKIYRYDNRFFVNNGGWIHELKMKDLLRRKKFRPNWLAIEDKTTNPRSFRQIEGSFLFDANTIYGCSLYVDYGSNGQADKFSGKAVMRSLR